MRCRNCHHEYNGRFCPACGTEGVSGGWKNILLPLALVLLFFSVSFLRVLVYIQEQAEISARIDVRDRILAEQGKTPSSGLTSGGKAGYTEEHHPYVTVGGITLVRKSVTQSRIRDGAAAASGKVFLVFEWEIENHSGQEIYISPSDFTGYFDDYMVDDSLASVKYSELLMGRLANGKKMHGFIGYEVPKDWQKYEIGIDLDGMKVVAWGEHLSVWQ